VLCGLHPNVIFTQRRKPHEWFESIEDINHNYLLSNPKFRRYIPLEKGKKAKQEKAMVFECLNEKTEN